MLSAAFLGHESNNGADKTTYQEETYFLNTTRLFFRCCHSSPHSPPTQTNSYLCLTENCDSFIIISPTTTGSPPPHPNSRVFHLHADISFNSTNISGWNNLIDFVSMFKTNELNVLFVISISADKVKRLNESVS